MNKKQKNKFNHADLWDAILSQDEEKITAAVETLNQETVEYIATHLKKMITEEGWHPSQQASASFALQIINVYPRG
ncbi:MAG: hypothetical protein J7K66_04300 [Anaerolineaceae bacterium]|nr:hypothetical protein [Anaerolineaceae bacterium]